MFIASLVCLISGAAMITSSKSGEVFPIAVGAPISLSGIIMFMLAMISKPQEKKMSEKEIREWVPDNEKLPEAGKVMYRIDVTLDKPITTSILCGYCGELSKIKGNRPPEFTCENCNTQLWSNEEE